jgi:hypothetical protein
MSFLCCMYCLNSRVSSVFRVSLSCERVCLQIRQVQWCVRRDSGSNPSQIFCTIHQPQTLIVKKPYAGEKDLGLPPSDTYSKRRNVVVRHAGLGHLLTDSSEYSGGLVSSLHVHRTEVKLYTLVPSLLRTCSLFIVFEYCKVMNQFILVKTKYCK